MDVFVGLSQVNQVENLLQEPNEFNYDMIFKKVKQLKLDSENYPITQGEYAVTVHVHAFDERANNLLRNRLEVSFDFKSGALNEILLHSVIAFGALSTLI